MENTELFFFLSMSLIQQVLQNLSNMPFYVDRVNECLQVSLSDIPEETSTAPLIQEVHRVDLLKQLS